ncbi:response regulator transcription factor [Romboutsia sp. 1001713B170207_170306_H8]|uniref:response regulator transcription factor n=1 Tax=Romboutsia sp. 1001713B170207_170306_H8 TaxID=2787112 RepID=UPI000821ED44|nr:response regulator transcription factor [Romboutsia sp. 1001713B170207_170306_H8]SCH52540.1 Glycopeptide resistance-associated protein R [uncultured Clostridium sp.]
MTDIFIVEDDNALSREISLTLSKWGYSVCEVRNFENITDEVLEKNPKLVLMDINLPCYDGFYWCLQIRNFLKVPIIFISSRDNDMDIIMSINMGGDDYITKPFSPQILVAKIQAILRRTYSYNSDIKNEIIKFKDVILNIVEGKIYYKNKNTDLTKNELKIMKILMENQEKIVSREEIIENLWYSEEFISENTLTVNINRLRKKLESIGLEEFILTKKGHGYIIK